MKRKNENWHDAREVLPEPFTEVVVKGFEGCGTFYYLTDFPDWWRSPWDVLRISDYPHWLYLDELLEEWEEE